MSGQNLTQSEALPAGFTMRPPTLADAPALADMMNAYFQKYLGRSNYSAESVRGRLTEPEFNIEEDARIILNDKGAPVGYLSVLKHSPYVKFEFICRVHPDYDAFPLRQILMTWGTSVVQAKIKDAPADAQIVLGQYFFANDDLTLDYVKSAEYYHARNFYRMGISMENTLVPAPQFPPQITIKTFADVNNLRQLAEVDDETSRDHWGYVPSPIEDIMQDFQHWIDSAPNIDLNYWFLAMDGDKIAGMSLCLPYLDGQEDVGYVAYLAVRANWRRQGLALRLLHHSFTELQKLGRTAVTLDVDASSLTGATRLYEKAGMQVIEQGTLWEKILRDGKDYRTQTLED